MTRPRKDCEATYSRLPTQTKRDAQASLTALYAETGIKVSLEELLGVLLNMWNHLSIQARRDMLELWQIRRGEGIT